ncbi:MAG: ATP-dependent Clp protease adapter ClpS [Zetaproteobacteria bacterium]|nr:MAG: ATP-dependent Clp protease adapter ClpS [Zetaproteobacteria bacterium]
MSRTLTPDRTHKTAQDATEPQLQPPPMYRVLLLNDDFTPMDFVVDILIRHFQKTPAEATEIMWRVHRSGKGLCGIYPREIAESKVVAVTHASRAHGYPLRCVMERDQGA